MPRKLTLEERETVISFDDSGPEARIWTYNRALIKRLEGVLKLRPTDRNDHGGREYELPKKLISIRKPRAGRKMTAAQKKAAGDRLSAGRQKASVKAKAIANKRKQAHD